MVLLRNELNESRADLKVRLLEFEKKEKDVQFVLLTTTKNLVQLEVSSTNSFDVFRAFTFDDMNVLRSTTEGPTAKPLPPHRHHTSPPTHSPTTRALYDLERSSPVWRRSFQKTFFARKFCVPLLGVRLHLLTTSCLPCTA